MTPENLHYGTGWLKCARCSVKSPRVVTVKVERDRSVTICKDPFECDDTFYSARREIGETEK